MCYDVLIPMSYEECVQMGESFRKVLLPKMWATGLQFPRVRVSVINNFFMPFFPQVSIVSNSNMRFFL